MSDMIKLSGMWRNNNANGDPYYSGSIGTARLLMFPNQHRETDKQPEWILYLAPPKKREETAPEPDENPPF